MKLGSVIYTPPQSWGGEKEQVYLPVHTSGLRSLLLDILPPVWRSRLLFTTTTAEIHLHLARASPGK